MPLLSLLSAALLAHATPAVPTPVSAATAPTAVATFPGFPFPKLRLPKRARRNASGDAMSLVDRRLRLLVSQQEASYADHGRYTKDVGQVSAKRAPADSALDAVSVQIVHADRRGWTAMASHPGAPGRSCVVFVGFREALPYIPRTRLEANEARDEGRPACDSSRDR